MKKNNFTKYDLVIYIDSILIILTTIFARYIMKLIWVFAYWIPVLLIVVGIIAILTLIIKKRHFDFRIILLLCISIGSIILLKNDIPYIIAKNIDLGVHKYVVIHEKKENEMGVFYFTSPYGLDYLQYFVYDGKNELKYVSSNMINNSRKEIDKIENILQGRVDKIEKLENQWFLITLY
jgi:hypothetical protein